MNSIEFLSTKYVQAIPFTDEKLALKKLTHQHNKTIIISTHQIELALQLSDEIWLLNNEKITVESPKEIVKTTSFNHLFNDKLVTFNTTTNSFRIKE